MPPKNLKKQSKKGWRCGLIEHLPKTPSSLANKHGNTSTQEAEAGGSQVGGQCVLLKETLSQNKF
jgi:hypothetical protein